MRLKIIFSGLVLITSIANANIDRLNAAVRGNDFEAVKKFLTSKDNINEEDTFGRRPIFFAADPRMVKFLITKGASFFKSGESCEIHSDVLGMNPLHYLLSQTSQNLFESINRHPRKTETKVEVVNRMAETASAILDANRIEIKRKANCRALREAKIMHVELQSDRNRKFPFDYLDEGWPLSIIDKMRFNYARYRIEYFRSLFYFGDQTVGKVVINPEEF